ncbi:MAG: hypothetical protein EBU49_06950, partial [Proteobacteria bacterium]|nr:hypothetical protein [Pseudomonadota bacterium]
MFKVAHIGSRWQSRRHGNGRNHFGHCFPVCSISGGNSGTTTGNPGKSLPTRRSTLKKIHLNLTLWLVIALAAGILTGVSFGPSVAFLGDLGKPVISIIKTVATPLVFFAIVDAVVTTHVRGISFLRLVTLTTFNGCIALAIGLCLHAFFQPGEALRALAGTSQAALNDVQASGSMAAAAAAPALTLDLQKVLDGFVPKSIVDPFSTSNIAGIVVLALLAGFGLRAHAATSREAQESVDRLAAINHTML